jgi:hypothetical protein
MAEFFSHDYNARNDLKIKKLFMAQGLSGIGLYWSIVEMLYEKGGYIENSYIPTIAFDLRTTTESIESLVKDFGLFSCDKKRFFSESILKRLNVRAEKSEKARKNIEARWKREEEKYDCNTNVIQTNYDRNTNELQTKYDRNTIKENKIKEYIKENNIKEKEKEMSKEKDKESLPPKSALRFTPPTLQEVKAYCNERNNSVDAKKFVDFYESKGWMVGKNKMKDWKAAVRTWEREDNKQTQKQGGGILDDFNRMNEIIDEGGLFD